MFIIIYCVFVGEDNRQGKFFHSPVYKLNILFASAWRTSLEHTQYWQVSAKSARSIKLHHSLPYVFMTWSLMIRSWKIKVHVQFSIT